MNFKPLFTDEHCKILNNESDVCKVCKGKCCSNSGCCIIPKDFKSYPDITKDDIMIALASGCIVMSREYDNYFLVMRGINTSETKIYSEYPSQCIALTENGCRYKFENRPFGGRILRPQKDTMCAKGSYRLDRASLAWKNYQGILNEIIDEYLTNEFKFLYELIDYKKKYYDETEEVWG